MAEQNKQSIETISQVVVNPNTDYKLDNELVQMYFDQNVQEFDEIKYCLFLVMFIVCFLILFMFFAQFFMFKV